MDQQYAFSDRQASKYGSRFDWSHDEFCQSLCENPGPKSKPILFVSKEIKVRIANYLFIIIVVTKDALFTLK